MSEPDQDFEVEMVDLSELHDHPRNYKQHPDDQMAHLNQSLESYGYYRNVVIARDGTILAGHGVVKAARERGWQRVPVHRLDLAPDDPAALKVVALDNEVARLAEVDDRLLSELLREVKEHDVVGLLGTGYDEMMLANLVYVTRPEGEIRDLQRASEWVGMPEYDESTGQIRVIVSFMSEADRQAFAELVGVKLGKGTMSMWWPPRPEKDDVISVRFEEQAG